MNELPVIKTIGRYEVLREVGRGGMAAVYLARQIELDRFVAVKELGSFHASDPTVARRFLRESRLAGSLTHTNIVTVFDYFEHEGTPYIAMEYVDRGSLRPYVGHMSLAQIGGVLEGTLAGLAHAEERRIVHRDLKPENIMVTIEGRVKIADFGIAKATDQVRGASVLTQTGMTVGTPLYMAPEQAMGQGIGPWTDLYSVGCITFELFSGRLPFDDPAPMAVLLKHINEQPPTLSDLVPDVDPAISEWVAELLVKDPDKRPGNANDVWVRFEEILIGKLGPRWRREARLQAPSVPADPGSPLTPAPFTRGPGPDASASLYDSFSWSGSGEQLPGPLTPPAVDAPDGPLELGPIDVPVGPPTPPVLPVTPAPVQDLETAPGFPVSGAVTPGDLPETEVVRTPDVADTMLPVQPLPGAAVAAGTERPRRRGLLVGGGATALVAVVAVAVVLGSGGASDPRPTPTPIPPTPTPTASILDAGPVRLTTAPGWKPLATELPVEGLVLSDAAGAAPGGEGDDGAILAGVASRGANQPVLLPAAFLESLGLRRGVVPDRTVVKLGGGVSAYRYGDLRPIGLGRSLTVFAAPTDAGVATVACVAPAADGAAFTKACEQAARSVTLEDADAFPLGPSTGYGEAVDDMLAALGKTLEREREALRDAKTPKGQGKAAKAIAGAYRKARSGLPALAAVSPADHRSRAALSGALADAARAWDRVAAAATRNRRGSYSGAASAAERAERRVADARKGVRADGYQALVTAAFKPARVPKLAVVHRPTPTPPPSGDGPSPPHVEPTPPPHVEPTPPPHVEPTPPPHVEPTPPPYECC